MWTCLYMHVLIQTPGRGAIHREAKQNIECFRVFKGGCKHSFKFAVIWKSTVVFKLTPHASLLSCSHGEQTSENRHYMAPLTYGISPSTGFVPKQPTPTAAQLSPAWHQQPAKEWPIMQFSLAFSVGGFPLSPTSHTLALSKPPNYTQVGLVHTHSPWVNADTWQIKGLINSLCWTIPPTTAAKGSKK